MKVMQRNYLTDSGAQIHQELEQVVALALVYQSHLKMHSFTKVSYWLGANLAKALILF
jgi:hypothetical protein